MIRMKEIEKQTDYLQSKSIKNNIHMHSIPEKTESNDMTSFLSKFFSEALGFTGILIFSGHIVSTEKIQNKLGQSN